MINISPGIIIAMAGTIGLLITFIDNSGEIGSKIPIASFFIVIISIGIMFEMFSKEKMDEIYGEFGEGRDYS